MIFVDPLGFTLYLEVCLDCIVLSNGFLKSESCIEGLRSGKD